MKTPFNFDGHQLAADVSIGIALAPGDAVEAEDLMKSADMALYGSKADRRGAFRFFEPQMDERMESRRALELQIHMPLAEASSTPPRRRSTCGPTRSAREALLR